MKPSPRSTWPLVLLTGLSLSLGWGIRGNFGHEYGAMIPGALAAMAAVLLSGRDDWWGRIAYFGMFGALGWSLGGSISYMQVIAYTHSGHSGSVLYGFACLFVIGFLWAAMGGAGTALPAFLDRQRLTEFFAPLLAIFAAWWLQDILEDWFVAVKPEWRHQSPLYWYDTDWLAALLALVSVLTLAVMRRRWDQASSLITHMAIGWWTGFLLLVVVLGWRMTPPRGDNWAGCVGMTIGLIVFLQRNGLKGVTFASLVCGFIGGFGFATATLLKLIEVKSGWETNWHSVLEQTYGFINGIGVAVALGCLAARAPKQTDESPARPWSDIIAVAFVLLLVTYLNLRKNPDIWVKAKAVPESMYGIPLAGWFVPSRSWIGWLEFAYLAVALAIIGLMVCHRRGPLPSVPTTWLGKGQLLYFAFLWWVVIGNFERALVSFSPQRLATEGVIHVNAVICTVLLMACAKPAPGFLGQPSQSYRSLLRITIVAGIAGMILSILLDWGIVRAMYGDQFAGYAGLHVRFGPHATATKEKPKAGEPHP